MNTFLNGIDMIEEMSNNEFLEYHLKDVIRRTTSTSEKMEAIKLLLSLREDHIC